MTTIAADTLSQLLRQFVGHAGWRNERSSIVEALPHLSENLSSDDILQTLCNLGIPYEKVVCREDQITDDECPALVMNAQGATYIAVARQGRSLSIVDPELETETSYTPKRQRCEVIRIQRHRFAARSSRSITVAEAFGEFRPILPVLLLSSFLVNCMGLLAPLLIMAIYDLVIPAGSRHLLMSLGLGVAIILATDFALRHTRTKALAHVGRQGERALSQALFEKLMSMPLHQLQKSDVDQQVSRFRQFESLRDVFTGQIITTFLDIPFVLLFLGVLFYLAPLVGLVTLLTAVVLMAMSLLTIHKKQSLERVAVESSAAVRSVFLDGILHQNTVRNLGLADVWQERSQSLVEDAEIAQRHLQHHQTLVVSAGQTLTSLAIFAAVVVTTHGAMNGSVSFGALIAVIALVSKVLAPITSLCANAPQILTFLTSRAQADRVLSLPQELELGAARSHKTDTKGRFAFSNVTYREDPQQPPVLSHVSFALKPGELVVIFGNDMLARQAVLDLMDGAFDPLAGSVELDGIDLRQIPRDNLRRVISYATFEPKLFYGTILQNFRLAAPGLSQECLVQALSDVGLEREILALPEGLDTRLTEAVIAEMPKEIIKALTLARTIARDTNVTLFAEPTLGLGGQRREAFKTWLLSRSKETTVVVSTADHSLIDAADRVIYLNQGRVAVNDCGEAGHKKLRAMLRARG